MSGIISRIEAEITPGTIIPKPETDREYCVKGWGGRRGERALVYWVPNFKKPARARIRKALRYRSGNGPANA